MLNPTTVSAPSLRRIPANKKPTLDPSAAAELLARAAAERKAQDIVILDVRGRSSYTEFLVIASGTSDRHVQAIAGYADEVARNAGIKRVSTEGLREGQWALIDFGHVMFHVFHTFTRPLYDLQGLWQGAPCTVWKDDAAPL